MARNKKNRVKKGLSPLLATVILAALVLSIGIILNSMISNMFQSEKEKTENLQTCSHAGIMIEDVVCINKTLKIFIQNSGSVALSDFHIYAKISGELYTNATPVNYDIILEPGDSIILEAYVPHTGNVEIIKVYTKTCPGISAEITDETLNVKC